MNETVSQTGLTPEELKTETKAYQQHLTDIQQSLRAAKIPVLVQIEGWAAAGKGSLINDLISELDPRFADVFVYNNEKLEEDRYPFLWPFFCAIPENGKFMFMDSGWMESLADHYCFGRLDGKEYAQRMQSAARFERQLVNNGYLVVKFFIDITKKEQKERFDALKKKKSTAWRVAAEDDFQHEFYDRYEKVYHEIMDATNELVPWHVLNGSDKAMLKHEAFRILAETVDAALLAGKFNGEPYEESFPMTEPPRLADADLTACIDDETYDAERKRLQKKIARLQYKLYRRGIPMVVCYEGWDAAGKGGNIRRLTYPLDPRSFRVHPISSPEPHEKARHHLWRFWTRLPKNGQVAIFDRTWYGRVMVERLEGFCTENDWKRAYAEMNEFEEDLHNWGAIILKFWIQVDSDTQLERFTMRQNTPEKQWKITEEDWRNREKWPQYEEAVSEMLEKTSTTFAPWHIIESNDKKYARIKVLQIVADAMESALKDAK